MNSSKMRKQEPKDDLEVDAIAEQELSRLQRHYRIMEGDRESFSEEAKFFLNKQRCVFIVFFLGCSLLQLLHRT